MMKYFILLILLLVIYLPNSFSLSFRRTPMSRRRITPSYDDVYRLMWRPRPYRTDLMMNRAFDRYFHPFQIEMENALTDLHDQFESYFADQQDFQALLTGK